MVVPNILDYWLYCQDCFIVLTMGHSDVPSHSEGDPAQGPQGPAGNAVDDGIRDTLMELLTVQLRFRHLVQEGLGVDYAGLSTMIHLAQVGSDTPTAIARTLETSTAATSLVLNRLEASGHISRQPHPKDRRKVVVAPVRASLAAAREYSRPVIEGTDQLAATLTPAERSTVARFLEGLIHVYDDALRDGK